MKYRKPVSKTSFHSERLQRKTVVEHQSKKSEPAQNRLTRRMKSIMDRSESNLKKCIICLSDFEEQYAILDCAHTFCIDCATLWWRSKSSCPYCRAVFTKIHTNRGRVIYFESLAKLPKKKDEDFIPHCEMCWGDIEKTQKMRICTVCRSVYWHERCLNFRSKVWYCQECANEE